MQIKIHGNLEGRENTVMDNKIEERRRQMNEKRREALQPEVSKSLLAKQAGISRVYLDMVIKGECTPGAEIASRLCQALDANFEDIFYASDVK